MSYVKKYCYTCDICGKELYSDESVKTFVDEGWKTVNILVPEIGGSNITEWTGDICKSCYMAFSDVFNRIHRSNPDYIRRQGLGKVNMSSSIQYKHYFDDEEETDSQKLHSV